ncbi:MULTISPECIES: LytTR family DNA-binding domain-containing protein [unclassified Spirosoma]|uniref:LytR/AlgR family response regulator transcription factor n=1 Tax=unclassified Spirosoma TaxID=2621999 RepID=UPI00095C0DCA|nr:MULTISPECIES: LytTR family DNA-binding domain-containing protein [unclassified Spirosoma]MBN8820640.1 response regulator transcription factor [Spirosoma sp.]OJW70519.1 MAG: hypothetical protein BGO59_25100 [Spirosoma sp. 48-14]
MLKILILEDNVIEQVRLTSQLQAVGYNRNVCVTNINDAQKAIRKTKPDLLIADIFLQQGTSLNFVYEQTIPTIFITIVKDIHVYESLKSKNLFAYIVKPVETCTLLGSINLLLQSSTSSKSTESIVSPTTKDTYFVVRQGKGQYRIDHSDIVFLQSEGNYTHLVTTGRKFIVKKSMRQLLAEIKSDLIRTHKQYSINVNYITRVEQTRLLVNDQEIPISKRFRPSFMKAFLQRNQKLGLLSSNKAIG